MQYLFRCHFQDVEKKPYFVDRKREVERLHRKQSKSVRKSSKDRAERTTKNQLTRRQIKRKERFAKYRLEKKIQRQMMSENVPIKLQNKQQQKQPQPQPQPASNGQKQQSSNGQQQPSSSGQQQQSNIQQNSAPITEIHQQTPTEWNEQPRVVFVQVRRSNRFLQKENLSPLAHKTDHMHSIHSGSTNGLSTHGLWDGTYALLTSSTEWFLSSISTSSTTLPKAETNVQRPL